MEKQEAERLTLALAPSVYRDGEGCFWGYINYIYVRRMSWICLSDPTNETLPTAPKVVAAVDREG